MKDRIPKRMLIVRPDAYGDIVLFDPALRLLKHHWTDTEVAVLIQERYLDIAPLIAPGIRWLTTKCDPYRESVDSNREALEALRHTVVSFSPDCVVAACFDKTWIEAVVAEFAPEARHVSVGSYQLDPISKIILQEWALITPSATYSETVDVEENSLDWDKNLRLASYLLDHNVSPQTPVANVPQQIRRRAHVVLDKAELKPGAFIACCPAGIAKVAIKAWPAKKYGEILAWLQKKYKLKALILGHENENAVLEEVRQSARDAGANPVIWSGKDGEIALAAGLLQAGRMYFGNDTGALHLAAALGKPVVSIFGGGHWPRFKPVGKRAVTVVQPLPCFGCGWDCYFGDAPCVKTIDSETVKKSLHRVLKSSKHQNEEMIAHGGISAAEHSMIRRTAETAHSVRHLKVSVSSRRSEWLRRSDLVRLIKQLEFSESDRAARLEVIHRQGAEVGKLQQEVRQGTEQSAQSKLLREQLEVVGTECNQLKSQLEVMRGRLANSESDRAARLGVIQQQGAEIGRLRQEARQGVEQETQNKLLREQLETTGTERNQLKSQLEALRAQLAKTEADRTARLDAVRQLATEIEKLQQTAAQSAEKVVESRLLREQLEIIEAERNSLKTQLEELRGHFVKSEADREARLHVIERQGAELERLYGELRVWLEEVRKISLKSYETGLERARLEQELEGLKARTADLDAERVKLLQEVQTMEANAATLDAERTASLITMEKQSGEISTLKQETERWRLESETISGKLHDLQQERTARLITLEKQSGEISDLKNEIARWRVESETMSGKLHDLQQELKRLTEQSIWQTQALEESLRSQEIARTRVKELQTAMSEIDNRMLVRILKRCGLWAT